MTRSQWLRGGRPVRTNTLGIILAIAAALVASGLVALAGPHPNGAGLTEVGPISSDHGFPVWYRDSNGVRLQPCIEHDNPRCIFGEAQNPEAPFSFPDNFPNEIFWWLGEASMETTGGGSAMVTMALEGAFANEVPIQGEQVAFGRVRIRVDNLQVGATYTVTHPYGVDTFVVEQGGPGSINMTEDIGIGAWDGAFNSRVGPFLTWASGAPAGYVGDPNIPSPVTGSPYGTNFFRIEGPGVGAPGAANLCQPLRPDPTSCIETNLFAIMGQIATNSGVDISQVTYSRTSASGGVIDIFASSEHSQSIVASSGAFYTTALRGEGRNYVGRIAYSGALPSQITISNAGDNPPAVKTATPIDMVTITQAEYDADNQRLTVSAFSSDQASPGPALSIAGYGSLAGGTIVVENVAAPPVYITVNSSAGGYDTEQVRIVGASFAPIPVQALAGPNQEVQQGQLVTLSGAASLGDVQSYSWALSGSSFPAGSDISGLPASASGPSFSFTAPGAAGSATYTLTVDGPGGPHSAAVTVTVLGVSAPVANAGPDQSVIRTTTVQLDASASSGATGYSWTQLEGPPVSLASPGSAATSFVFPNVNQRVVLQLTVSGPGGSASDTVTITPLVDTVTITSAVHRSGAYRVRGTATINSPANGISVYLGTSCGGTLVGRGQLDPVGGDFDIRVAGAAPPAGSRVTACSTAGGQSASAPVRIR